MHSRLRHVVTTLAILAASTGVQAADQITIDTGRFNLHATVSTNEVYVSGGPIKATRRNRLIAVVAGGREAINTTASGLLARGEATRASAVLYLDGRLNDNASRVLTTRRILLQLSDGQNPTTLAAAHGLKLLKQVPHRPSWWIAETISKDVFASVDTAVAIAADPARQGTRAIPILQMPAASDFTPNDPAYNNPIPPGPPGFQWQLGTFPGVNASEVWNRWTGAKTGSIPWANIAISDTALELAHLDLRANARGTMSYDYANDDDDPEPTTTEDDQNHATAVAGMAAAVGDNNLGVVGVAYGAGIIANRILKAVDVNGVNPSSIAPDDRMYDAITANLFATDPDDIVWANNNSWGPGGGAMGTPNPLHLAGMEDATTDGRGGFGVAIIHTAGNAGTRNPNDSQNTTGFRGHINRFTIGVGAISNRPAGHKATYSSVGPNLTTTAPGGDSVNSRTGLPDPIVMGVVTTDRTGDDGYITTSIASCDFDGNLLRNYPFENGDYVPPGYYLMGTSFAAPMVTATSVLMMQARTQLSYRDIRQIMMLRGQDQVQYLPEFLPLVPGPHDDWGQWDRNGVNMLYCNWYGFGAVDVGRFVYGGDGTESNRLNDTALDEPGALRWPLLPALLTKPVTVSATFPIPTADTATSDPYALFDAPKLEKPGPVELNMIRRGLVFDGRAVEGIGTRVVRATLNVEAEDVPSRFRVDTVELTVQIDGVGLTSYPTSPNLWPKGGPNGNFYWSDYAFRLTSPSGRTCILGRQEEENGFLVKGVPFKWTFSETFHTNETVAGDWTLTVLSENNRWDDNSAQDPANLNPPDARLSAVTLAIYGHQTYAQPRLNSTSTSGLPSGVGSQTLRLDCSDLGISQGEVEVAQAYWYPDDLTNAPVELKTRYDSSDKNLAIVTIPSALLLTASPGQGYVAIANPAVVIGRSSVAPTAVDYFDDPFPATPMPSASVSNPSRYMKRCTNADTKRIRYSRPPTLTPIADQEVDKKGTLTLTTTAYDPDVADRLPTSDPEVLTVTATSFNPTMVGDPVATQITPTADGLGTYSLSVPVLSGDSAFALIQVSVTDGVTTTIQSFRVIHPTDLDASGCGGGMGLALIGIPLCVWVIRRRRR